MSIKALFLDLDGTLLTSDKKVSTVTLSTLAKCKECGIKLFVATGRSPRSIANLDWGISNLVDGGVFCNGGQIMINEKETFAYIPDNVSRAIVEAVDKYEGLNIALHLKSHDEKWAFRFPLSDFGYKMWGMPPSDARILDKNKNLETVKILIFNGGEMDWKKKINEELVTELEAICKNSAQFYLAERGTVISIGAKDTSKKTGVERIRERLGLEKDEVAVFGDDFNDFEMISEYKHSVAMGNAEEAIKKAATHITLTSDEDGVHYAIANILKLI